MARSSKAKAKHKAAPAKAPEPERKDNRYLRAARVIIEAGEGGGLDPIYLSVKAGMSASTAGHCIEAFKGVTQALREAKLLPAKKALAEAPSAPKAQEPATVAEEPDEAAQAA